LSNQNFLLLSLMTETHGDNLFDLGGKEVKKKEFNEDGPFYM